MFCGRALPELVEKLSAVAGVYRWCHAPRWLRLMSACARIPLPSTEHILGFSGHSWAAPKSCQTRHGASGAASSQPGDACPKGQLPSRAYAQCAPLNMAARRAPGRSAWRASPRTRSGRTRRPCTAAARARRWTRSSAWACPRCWRTCAAPAPSRAREAGGGGGAAAAACSAARMCAKLVWR